ncbi:YhhA family cyclophane-containing RiPP [Pedobacter psychrodurus]|uniref:YhhA family cyclophane-containing RiPP n=1 Tax=Pedobacter psychrodurus TaxID=2530456 RepID=UPI0029315FB7|nr:YhhA family cyclophane-containing RiPP [Pedobacter psychrodurus]
MEQLNISNLDAEKVFLRQPLTIDPAKMDNEVLKRLIGEIDFDRANKVNSYNRTHNRHNRGR